MRTPNKLLTALAVAPVAVLGVTTTANAGPSDEPPVELPAETDADPATVDAPDDHLVVFSADARVDGHRVDEEWILAFGYEPYFPFHASLWLLVDADDDEWLPLCFGYVLGDDDGAVFVGGSALGDEDDGCTASALGDDGGVAFAAVELEGDSVLTAAMYELF